MEECDEGPTPRARVGSGAAGVHRLRHRRVGQQHPGLRLTVGVPAQARAEVGTGRRSQPHAGPQIAS